MPGAKFTTKDADACCGPAIVRITAPAISEVHIGRNICYCSSAEVFDIGQLGWPLGVPGKCGSLSLFHRARQVASFGLMASFRLGLSTWPSAKSKSVRKLCRLLGH